MYSSVISPLKDTLTYCPAKTTESNHNIIIPTISRVEKIPENGSKPEILKRSISANSVLPKNMNCYSSLAYHNKAIEYLTSQYKLTLEQLHLEVARLKTENQRLNFKILVEDNGGVEKIVNESLSENRTLKNNIKLKRATGCEISNERLLNETVRDLKIKLDISEDANKHLNSTIRNLKQKMSMMKRFNLNSETPEGSTKTTDRFKKPAPKASPSNTSRRSSNHNLNTPEKKADGDLQLGYVHSQKSQSKVKLSNLHFPCPPTKVENFTKVSRPNIIKRHQSQTVHLGNKFERVLEEKDLVINQLTTQNSLHKNRISELENILGELRKAFQNNSSSRSENNKSGANGLRSTASKNSFHLPNINQHIVGNVSKVTDQRDFLINYEEDA